MRSAIAALALTLAACSPAVQPGAKSDQPAADAHASASGVTAPFTLQRETLIGTWSLDRSCASGNGMRLSADGTAGLGEGYAGTWAMADNNRVVLTLEGYGRVSIQNLDVAYPVTDDLIATMSDADGSGPRGLFARSCSPVPGAAATTQPAAMPAAPFTLQREALIGTWSFDRSCGSEDGMSLERDGAVHHYAGSGTWAMAGDNRIVLTLEESEMGVGPTGETIIYNLDVARPVTDDLIASMSRRDGSMPSGVFARRCPPPQ